MQRHWKNLFLIFALIKSTGCSQFTSQRSFLAEMENEDTRFFTPNQDFPVVAGDNGNFGITEEERRERTPSSVEEIHSRQNTISLEEELHSLEGKQPENALNFYNKHRSKLVSTSERIYFLKLPHNERHEYLESRAMIEKAPLHNESEKFFATKQSDILFGMSKDDVSSSWGTPLRVEVAGNPSYENERWLYKLNGASKYVYFESGKVEGWE